MIKLFVAYYAIQVQGKEIVSHHYDWLHDNAVKVALFKDRPRQYEINATRYRFENEIFHAFFWYDVNGTIAVNRYKAKISTALNAILNRRTNGSLVVITLQNGRQTTSLEFKNKVLSFIKEYIPIFQNYMHRNRKLIVYKNWHLDFARFRYQNICIIRLIRVPLEKFKSYPVICSFTK